MSRLPSGGLLYVVCRDELRIAPELFLKIFATDFATNLCLCILANLIVFTVNGLTIVIFKYMLKSIYLEITNERKINMVKKLPIKLQREINNLMYNAAYLSIILNYDNMYPWFYENYTQLYFTSNKIRFETNTKEIFMDFYGGWTAPKALFDLKYMTKYELEEKNKVDLIKRILNKDEYIFTYIDEYYVGEKEHNSHDVLIYGYDDDREEFSVLGFKDNFFVDYAVDYSLFEKSFNSSLQIAKENTTKERKYQLISLTPLFDENTEYKFDLYKFMSVFKQYLNSEYSKLNLYDDTIYEDGILGIQIYTKLLEALQNPSGEKQEFDYRLVHTLYEHKKIMLERVEYIYKSVLMAEIPTALQNGIESIVELANTIRLQAIEYVFTNDNAILYAIGREIERLYAEEKETYNALYNELRNSILSRSFA